MLLILILVCTLAGVRFIFIGAWPVVVFLAIDLIGLWLAFYLNYRSARACERIKLTDNDLLVERISANGDCESWSFEPSWVTLKLLGDEHYENRLELALHQQRVIIGQFLSPDERIELYEALLDTLYRWRHRTYSS